MSAPTAVLHRARWVLPVSAPPIEDGAVLIDAEGVIRDLGRYGDLAPEHRGRVADHGRAVVIPGLVNAHTHLDLSALVGQVRVGVDFGTWLGEVTRSAATVDPGQAVTAMRAAIRACVATGTVLVGDITGGGGSVPALRASPLHARVFHELIGFDPRHAGTLFAEAKAKLLAAEAEAPGPRLRHALAAHAPYSVSSRLLRLLRGFDAAAGRPTSIHLAESTDEDRFFMTGSGSIARLKERLGTTVSGWEPPGQPSIAYLWRLGWFETAGLAVHCTQLGARGIDLLRRAPMTACLCPRSNETLGVGVAPARALIDAGVPLAVGTDSLASVSSLSMFDELGAAARIHPGVEPRMWLRAATRGGAQALGFGDRLGSLAPGFRGAALAVHSGSVAIADPYELLLSAPGAERIEHLDPELAAEAAALRPVAVEEHDGG